MKLDERTQAKLALHLRSLLQTTNAEDFLARFKEMIDEAKDLEAEDELVEDAEDHIFQIATDLYVAVLSGEHPIRDADAAASSIRAAEIFEAEWSKRK